MKKMQKLPKYLRDHYAWAYLRPLAVWIFDRQWMVNLILLNQAKKLWHLLQAELNPTQTHHVLQMACVYGHFSKKLVTFLSQESRLTIIDIAAIQLKNLKKKLAGFSQILYKKENASKISCQNNTYSHVILFFLLHEQPQAIRKKTLLEALRVVRANEGKVIVIDYHAPKWYQPIKYLFRLFIAPLEPYLLEFWENSDLNKFLKDSQITLKVEKKTLFGGLYQKTILRKISDSYLLESA